MKNINQILIDGVEATLNSDFEKAENIFRKALEICEPDHIILYNLGIVLMKTERYGEALEIFEAALEIRDNDPDIWIEAGLACQKTGKKDRALSCYSRAMDYADDKSVIYNNIGTIYFSEENYAEAKKVLQNGAERKTAATQKQDRILLWQTLFLM